MRSLLFAALFIAIGLPASSQATPPPPQGLPKDPRAILDAAAPYYDFSDPALKPFHLKASYQLYDDQGNPAEQGTFEYWWASPTVYRLSWTRPHAMHISWHTADGKEAYIESGERLRYFEREILTDLTSPLPTSTLIDPKTASLKRYDTNLAGVQLACISLTSHGAQRVGDGRENGTYCFDSSLPVLRVTYRFNGMVLVSFDQVVRLGGKFLAREIHAIGGKQTLFTFKVDTIDALNPLDPTFAPPSDAIFKPDAVRSTIETKHASLIKQAEALYPKAAKDQHIQGTVLIDVLIGADGKVKDTQLIVSQPPLFGPPALKAVAQWQFRPPEVNGAPIETQDTVEIDFRIAGG